MVGSVVIVIVVTAGMVSTTWVQFLKGSLLVVFSAVLTVLILNRGLVVPEGASTTLVEPQTVTLRADGTSLINGLPQGTGHGQAELRPVGHVARLPDGQAATGPLGPIEFFRVLSDSEVVLWASRTETDDAGAKSTVYFPKPTKGSDVLRPGNLPTFAGIRGDALTPKIDFLSLMLALFCGTASLPHILIRYYTVKDATAARKSTIVGIGSIGFFYVLTLYLGLGAMTSGALDVTNSNMAAPLLARSMNEWLFAIISAIAFTTVLGTVSGLIIAASGAVVHDPLSSFLKIDLHDAAKVRVARMASVGVGAVAIVLGILFERMNVNYLVGWAFSIAASANLPALVMLLFWKGTTRQGITAAILVGMVSSLGWILLSGDTYKNVYGLPAESAWTPLSQPGIVTIPLGFLTLILVSLATRSRPARAVV
jgi:cation/acetate symporter